MCTLQNAPVDSPRTTRSGHMLSTLPPKIKQETTTPPAVNILPNSPRSSPPATIKEESTPSPQAPKVVPKQAATQNLPQRRYRQTRAAMRTPLTPRWPSAPVCNHIRRWSDCELIKLGITPCPGIRGVPNGEQAEENPEAGQHLLGEEGWKKVGEQGMTSGERNLRTLLRRSGGMPRGDGIVRGMMRCSRMKRPLGLGFGDAVKKNGV